MSETMTYWGFQTLAMLITAILLPKFRVSSPLSALLMVLALAGVNATVWNAALFFSLPNDFTTHTVTLLLSNGLLFWVLVKLLPGIEIEGLFTAIVAPVLFTISSMIIYHHGKDVPWGKVTEYTFSILQDFKNGLISAQGRR